MKGQNSRAPRKPQRATFRVDSRLTALLGENYRSTEHALTELVDNAWDADAENVWIDLPDALTDQPIVVTDDGSGMTEQEVRSEYLRIASDRRSRKGERTPRLARLVKGRKGIGKFAGLVAADKMEVTTKARGKATTINIVKEDILSSRRDLERIPLPMKVVACSAEEHGTTIRLSELSDRLEFPKAEALKELLVLQYGRQSGFTIHVNNEPISHEDISGDSVADSVELPAAGEVSIQFTIMEPGRRTRQPGIVMKVGGKVVGKPSFFGLDERDDIPRKLLNRLVGEVEADSLEDDLTADNSFIVENSKGFQEAQEWIKRTVSTKVEDVFRNEIHLAKARRQKQINQAMAAMPEYRREFAQEALERVLRKFFGESEEKIDVLVSLVLEAFEKDEYWAVCQSIQAAKNSDVFTFAEALECFGLTDMAVMARQARRRMEILDQLDVLASNTNTLEAALHKALESNLWVLGSEYLLMSSNATLARVIEEYARKEFLGDRAKKRPDLLLAQNVLRKYLLIEFKRPAHTLTRDDENQAEKYRDDLTKYLPGEPMDILVVGGRVKDALAGVYRKPGVRSLTYGDLFSNARTQLSWLVDELTRG